MPDQESSTVADSEAARSQSSRILMAKVGLDGHDRGIKVVARGLRDAGFHVIYGGIWQSPEAVARAAMDEDADWLGLSLLNGAHMTLVPRVLDAIRETGNTRTRFLLGGIIPEEDLPELHEMGVAGVFGPGSSMPTIADFLRTQDDRDADEKVEAIIDGARQGDRRSVARLLTLIEQQRVTKADLNVDAKSSVRTVAFTGSAGVGKSSLIAAMLPILRKRLDRIAVLACDPQSPITGGALLGDRIRMSDVGASDDQVMIRSLGVKSGHQGISEHLDEMISALGFAGFDLVIIESVGIGQGDIAVKEVTDNVVVLLQPESGDDVQWEKAGVLEVADMIVIQKSDLPGADRLEAELRQGLNLPGFRSVPIVRVSAANQQGLDDLCEQLIS